MDDLKALMGTLNRDGDLIDRLMNFLDRQSDHKLPPQMLLGFLGLFNVLSIMSLVHDKGGMGSGIKEVSALPENNGISTQSLSEAFSGMLKPKEAGQPDLMGILGQLASKKKINPSLLLSLLSMMNQGGSGTAEAKEQEQGERAEKAAAPEMSVEKSRQQEKEPAEVKYDRKKGIGERG